MLRSFCLLTTEHHISSRYSKYCYVILFIVVRRVLPPPGEAPIMIFLFLVSSLSSTLKKAMYLTKFKKIYDHLLILSYLRNTLHVSHIITKYINKQNICSVQIRALFFFGNLFFMTCHLSFIVLTALSSIFSLLDCGFWWEDLYFAVGFFHIVYPLKLFWKFFLVKIFKILTSYFWSF